MTAARRAWKDTLSTRWLAWCVAYSQQSKPHAIERPWSLNRHDSAQQSAFPQPIRQKAGPGTEHRIRRRHAYSVRAPLEYVYLSGNASLSQRYIEAHAVLRGHAGIG